MICQQCLTLTFFLLTAAFLPIFSAPTSLFCSLRGTRRWSARLGFRLTLGLIGGGKQLADIPQDNGADQHDLWRIVDLGVQAALDRIAGADL